MIVRWELSRRSEGQKGEEGNDTIVSLSYALRRNDDSTVSISIFQFRWYSLELELFMISMRALKRLLPSIKCVLLSCVCRCFISCVDARGNQELIDRSFVQFFLSRMYER